MACLPVSITLRWTGQMLVTILRACPGFTHRTNSVHDNYLGVNLVFAGEQ